MNKQLKTDLIFLWLGGVCWFVGYIILNNLLGFNINYWPSTQISGNLYTRPSIFSLAPVFNFLVPVLAGIYVTNRYSRRNALTLLLGALLVQVLLYVTLI